MTEAAMPPEGGDSYDAESSLVEETVAVPGEPVADGMPRGEDPGTRAGSAVPAAEDVRVATRE